jgi:hypothetical protein
MEPRKNYVEIIAGAILALMQIPSFPMYLEPPLNTQKSAAIAVSIILFLGGLYLLYRGLYASNKS